MTLKVIDRHAEKKKDGVTTLKHKAEISDGAKAR